MLFMVVLLLPVRVGFVTQVAVVNGANCAAVLFVVRQELINAGEVEPPGEPCKFPLIRRHGMRLFVVRELQRMFDRA